MRNINNFDYLLPFNLVLFVCTVYIYLNEIINPGAGVDILWRVTEANYFLDGINPYDVFVGKREFNEEYGKPAAYAFSSYLLAAPFTLIKNKLAILAIYSFIDIYVLSVVSG